MDDYYNENVEYEMADGEIAVADTELVDIDVYDATREEAALASASISHPTGPTDQDISKKPTADRYLPESEAATTDHIPPISNLEPSLRQSAEPELLTPIPLQATVGQDHDTKPSDPSDAAVALQESTPHLAADTKDPQLNGEASTALERHTGSPRVTTTDGTSDNVIVLPLNDSEQKREPEFSPTEDESSASVPQKVTPGATVEEGSHQAEIQDTVRIPNESHEGGVPGAAPDSAEAGEPERPATESHETEEDDADPHEISEGVYIEPPPPVLLELPSISNQPVCSLFNAPSNLPSDDTRVNVPNAEASYTILFQTRPTLYYETLNDFFDALREEVRIQSITEFADGEMVIDAYDLQLIISEDNVHAREISLHDLNVLHHGLDMIGPLRLRLRTVLPRFINRYRSLQSQVTRLDVVRSASQPAEDEPSEEQAFVGSPHEGDSGYDHAVNHNEQTEREPTGDDGHEELSGGVDEREDVGSTYLDHAEYQGENGEADYDEYDNAQEYPQAPEDEANAREETDQFVTNDEPEPLPDADPTHKGSADPESVEYQERDDGDEDGEASDDAEVTSTITASTHANDTDFPGDELRILTEVRDSAATGEPQLEEIDERQALNTEHSSTVSDNAYGEEQADVDGFTEDGEAEDDITGDEPVQFTSPRNNLGVVTNEEEKGAASHEDTDEYIAQEAELATPAISSGVEILEPENPDHHAEEDENAESWELDDGVAIWEETAEGDEFDIGLVAEPDSVSTGSSTLSGRTASIASKRSFDEVDRDESEPTVEESSLQNLKKTRTR